MLGVLDWAKQPRRVDRPVVLFAGIIGVVMISSKEVLGSDSDGIIWRGVVDARTIKEAKEMIMANIVLLKRSGQDWRASGMQSSLINAICSLEGSLRSFDRGLRLFVASAATMKPTILITRHPQVWLSFQTLLLFTSSLDHSMRAQQGMILE